MDTDRDAMFGSAERPEVASEPPGRKIEIGDCGY